MNPVSTIMHDKDVAGEFLAAVDPDPNLGRQQVVGSPCTADQNRKFLGILLPWPGENSPGWINLHTNGMNPELRGKPFMAGWAYRTLNEFLNQARRSDILVQRYMKID